TIAAEQRDELAPFHCPMPPVLPTERIAHLGTADCCIHPPGRNEMIATTPPKIFSKEVAQKGHPISPPGPPPRKKSFLTKFPGWDLDENLKPKKSPYRGAHCRGSVARQNEVGLAARAARWPGCLGCGSCSGLLCDGEPRQQPLADLGATSAQL